MRHQLLLLLPLLLHAQSKQAQVDQLFAHLNQPGSPGCAIGILHGSAVAYQKGYGTADAEHNLPLTPQSVFYMASVSKQFTALSFLLAEQEGKLKLSDSIRKQVPELPAYADKVTYRRMLDHTSGLRDILTLWALRGWSTESVLQEQPSLDLLVRQKALNFTPGDEYNYSNSGYMLAAIALRRSTGLTLNDYATAHIFKPLGMTHSRFQHDHSLPVPNRASGYTKRDGAWHIANLGFNLTGAGGLYSSVEDMLLWAKNFENP